MTQRGRVAALISVVVIAAIWQMAIEPHETTEQIRVRYAERWPDLAQAFGTKADENDCIIRQAVRLRPARKDFAVSARAMCEGVAECAQEAKQTDYSFSAYLDDDGLVNMTRSRFLGRDGPVAFRRCVEQRGYSLSH